MITNFSFSFCDCNFDFSLGACNILLERYGQDLSNGILQAPHIPKILVGKPKIQICSYLMTAQHDDQKTTMEKHARFFLCIFFLLVMVETTTIDT